MGLEQRLQTTGAEVAEGVSGVSSQPSPAQKKRTYRIFMVDDNSDDITFLEHSINAYYEGHERVVFYKATCGQDALRQLAGLPADQEIDLIFTDIDMPGMTGIEFLRELRRNAAYSRYARTQAVATTGCDRNDKEKSELRALGLMEQDIIRKQMYLEKYEAIVADVLQRYCLK
ncbi:response regulator [Candidatus Woesearchaeota archaeon]|nr:response regulator [Candidatus Woesearchaeota archaeon]